jgi:hypothetical protein
LKNSGLTESDFRRKPEFVPLPGAKIQGGKYTVPAVSGQAMYKPLAAADLDMTGIPEVPNAKSADVSVIFAPMSEINLENTVQAAPLARTEINCMPLHAVTADIKTKALPSLAAADEYVPFADISVSGVAADVPAAVSAVNYSPLSGRQMVKKAFEVPALGKPVRYKQIKASKPNTVKEMPQLGKAPVFVPPILPAVSPMKCAVPIIGGNVGFNPLRKKPAKAMRVNLPVISAVSEYLPIEAAEIAYAKVDSPKASPHIVYIPMIKADEYKAHIEHPAAAHISDYVPLKKAVVSASAKFVPASKIKIAFTSVDAKKVAADTLKIQLAKEVTESKDFYSMWAAL